MALMMQARPMLAPVRVPPPLPAWQRRPVTALGGPLALPTHPIHNAMRRGLLVLPPEHEELVKLRVNGQLRLMKVTTTFRPRPCERPLPPRDANLLKTHLDLVDQARQGADGRFTYELPEALGRLGYRKLASGSYHPDTVRALADRLGALADMHVTLDPTGAESTPFWRFELEGAGGEASPHGLKASGRLVVTPGDWWRAIDLERYQAPLERALLALPMDGNGNEMHRLALLLAAELLVWERAERRKGAQRIARPVGTLLEKAMAAHKADLLADGARRLNTGKRLRAYLAGEGFADEGALALLRTLAGLSVDIKDEAAFWAAGRGWVERFWNARLAIELGDRDRPLASLAVANGPMANAHRRV